MSYCEMMEGRLSEVTFENCNQLWVDIIPNWKNWGNWQVFEVCSSECICSLVSWVQLVFQQMKLFVGMGNLCYAQIVS